MKMVLFLAFLVVLAAGCVSITEPPEIDESAYMEGEARVFQGTDLTPISQQGNFMIKGTQYIDRDDYILRVDGLVERPMNFTYEHLLAYPNTSRVVRLDSVDGWSFVAKWTGVPLSTLMEEVGADENATTVIFYGVDDYTTSLDMDYILEEDIILAYHLNDITLPPNRGFPVQVVRNC